MVQHVSRRHRSRSSGPTRGASFAPPRAPRPQPISRKVSVGWDADRLPEPRRAVMTGWIPQAWFRRSSRPTWAKRPTPRSRRSAFSFLCSWSWANSWQGGRKMGRPAGITRGGGPGEVPAFDVEGKVEVVGGSWSRIGPPGAAHVGDLAWSKTGPVSPACPPCRGWPIRGGKELGERRPEVCR